MIVLAAPVALVGGYLASSAVGAVREQARDTASGAGVVLVGVLVGAAIVGVVGVWLVLGAAERSGALALVPTAAERVIVRALDVAERVAGNAIEPVIEVVRGLTASVGEAGRAVLSWLPGVSL